MREPLHLSVARAFVGIKETPGPVSTSVILQWARDIQSPSWYHDDDQAWCAVWANRLCLAMQFALSAPPQSFDLLRAASFETWGQRLLTPTLGCFMTFKRPEGNHVGLYLGETDTLLRVLGGNQSNAVSYAWIKKDRLTSMRWPSSVPLATTGRILLASDASVVSTNEG
jgi:uncharacterized protein (TIGR02594 family)